jgi:hypothetical protein
MHRAFGDVEVDAVEGDDLTEEFADSARANREAFIDPGGPAGNPAGPPVMPLDTCCPEACQFASELGM